MAELGRLDIDVVGSINEFQSMMKEFRLKKEIYQILFRGKGLEFEGFRLFSPDDDASEIDWKTSARSTQLLVKQYKEERDLKIFFIIDTGRNMVFGSQEKLKCEFAGGLTAALSYLIISSNDQIGFFLFNDKIGKFVDYSSGEKQFQLFMDFLSDGKNYGGRTDINMALDYALEYLDKNTSSVIIISDFLNVNKETEKKMTLLANKFETAALVVKDPLDFTLPNVEGEIVLQDPSTGKQVIVNPKVAKRTYEKYALEQKKFVEDIFKKSNVDFVELITDKGFSVFLAEFLKKRSEEGK